MTAINCSHRRALHETRRRSERERRRGILGPSGIRPDRRNGPRGPGPRIPDSSSPSLSLPPLVATVGPCPSARRFSFSCFLGRTCNSDATSLRSQMEDPVPGIERVKHRLKACFPTGNRWENNGPTAPKVSDKCSARVAHPGPLADYSFFFFLTCENSGGVPSIQCFLSSRKEGKG